MQPGGTKRPPFISPLPSPLLPSYFYTLHIFATTKQDWLCCYTLLFFPSRFLPPLPTSLSSVRRPWNSPHLAKIKDVYRKKKRDEELFLSNSGKTPRSMVSNGKMHKRLFLVFSLCLSLRKRRERRVRERRDWQRHDASSFDESAAPTAARRAGGLYSTASRMESSETERGGVYWWGYFHLD